MNDEQIRASIDFVELCNWIKAKTLLYRKRIPSNVEITEKLCKYIDKDKVWQNEFNE
jgi:hypothetical protein